MLRWNIRLSRTAKERWYVQFAIDVELDVIDCPVTNTDRFGSTRFVSENVRGEN
jgi:hypothetical protein